MPGETITITGSDLGTSGTVAIANSIATVEDYTATSVTVKVPASLTGTLPVTVNCGRTSNTIGLTIHHTASTTITITNARVAGATAVLTIKLPSAGRLKLTGKRLQTTTRRVTKAATVKVTVRLTATGRSALRKAKAKRLAVGVKAAFTPTGGTTSTTTQTVTFKHEVSR